MFACEICYGTELVLTAAAGSGLFVTWIVCYARKLKNRIMNKHD